LSFFSLGPSTPLWVALFEQQPDQRTPFLALIMLEFKETTFCSSNFPACIWSRYRWEGDTEFIYLLFSRRLTDWLLAGGASWKDKQQQGSAVSWIKSQLHQSPRNW